MAPKFSLRRGLFAAATAIAAAGVAIAGAALAGDSYPAQTLQYSVRQPLNDSDSRTLASLLEAARMGDAARIRNDMGELSDPLARKIALWALIEVNADGLSYAELDGARRDLAGWPGAARREAAAEKVMEGGGLSPRSTIDWFDGAGPVTAQGAMALAAAYQATGQSAQAAQVIRHVWRTRAFDADQQQLMMSRFSAYLSADDYAAREDLLLYGSQGEAARALLAFLTPEQKAVADARMALRSGQPGAAALVDALPASARNTPGVAYEEALHDGRRGDEAGELASLNGPAGAVPEEAQSRMWRLRKPLVITAIKAGDARAAYRAAAGSGVDTGTDGLEAQFYAGWLALTRLKDPRLADQHFARLQAIGSSPISLSRAYYWRGRAAEAMGDPVNAQLFYADAARYPTAFYGQLGAAKAGMTEISIGKDPVITAADRARFEDREQVRAARMLADIGAKDTFANFVIGLSDTLPSAQEAAMLVDLVRGEGDQFLSMKVVRNAAKHGYILPERGYPLHATPTGVGPVEAAFILGITRQESGFDPHIRSPAGATGMMQLMPGTASIVARKLGYSYGAERLQDADFNMQLGSAFLGQLVDQFSGSYVMATAAYNAGPGRPTEWTTFCGDPRTASTDPADFIECIPFTETRDYVMRVMEGVQVYRARLAGGTARLTLPADLKRGGYHYEQSAALAPETPSVTR
jgi:soluble lytic murein transglycosylase